MAQGKGDQLGDWAMRGIRAYGVHRYHGAFSGSLWVVDLKTPIIVLFILAMMFLISALVVFLVEVKLATNTINMVRTIR